ncbi:MAG: hypothetical protein R3B60_02075 [Candidatus Paceibacterota bacterium]
MCSDEVSDFDDEEPIFGSKLLNPDDFQEPESEDNDFNKFIYEEDDEY